MVTPAVVREVLGDGEALPAAVRAAIARERRRLAAGSSDTDAATRTNDWIACLEKLPWTRRSEAPSDLARARAALDAGHAGLDEAKSCILEHLAVWRRNPRSGAVLCLAGPPGVGKTSLAQCTAEALGRGFVRLACGGLRDESDLRGHNRTWKDAQPGWILRELRRVSSKDPVVVLDEIDKIGTAPAAVLLEVLDPAQHAHFRDAFVELPFDLSEILFITTANEVSRIPPALRDRLEVVELSGYSENEKVAIGETHLIAAQNRAAGLTATPVRFTRGALRRIIREYTSEQGVRQFARRLQAICRKVALGLETGDASLVRGRVTVRQVHAFLGAPRIGHMDGVDRLGAQLDAPSLPASVRERGRQVLARLSAWSSTDPEHGRAREYQRCLAGVPWTVRAETTLDLARSRALVDAGHACHAAVKERLLDYVAVRLANPDAPSGVLCLLGPPGVGKSTLARLVAAALGRPCAWVDCDALGSAAAVHGSRAERPGRIVEALRRVGVRNPFFVLDEVDRLDESGGASAALLEAVDPMRGAAFCDLYLDLPFDLSEALFVATAARLGSVPPALRERMRVVELPGYTEAEKRGHCGPEPVAGTVAAARADGRRGRRHGRGGRGHHPRVYAGGGRVASGRSAGRGVRQGGAPACRGGRVAGRGHSGAARRAARRARVSGVGGGRAHGAAGRCRRAVLDDVGRRGGALRRSDHDGRLRSADPDRPPGGGDAGVGAGRAVVAAGQRRTLRRRPGFPPRHRHPPALGRGTGRRGVGRGRDGGGAGIGVDRARGPRRPGDDRRGHAVGPGAAGRRRPGEAAGGAPRRSGRHPAAGEPEGGRRGPGRGAASRGRGALRDAGRRVAGAGAGAVVGFGRAGGPGVLSPRWPGRPRRCAACVLRALARRLRLNFRAAARWRCRSRGSPGLSPMKRSCNPCSQPFRGRRADSTGRLRASVGGVDARSNLRSAATSSD